VAQRHVRHLVRQHARQLASRAARMVPRLTHVAGGQRERVDVGRVHDLDLVGQRSPGACAASSMSRLA
jgi:hypothetical protein